MKTISSSEKFANWLARLSKKDRTAAAIVARRIERLKTGLGDIEPVGDGVSELRIHVGPGYRIYFGELGEILIVILTGGTKRHQQADIDEAKSMFKDLKKKFAVQHPNRDG
jgi:putative addiction module killer protein